MMLRHSPAIERGELRDLARVAIQIVQHQPTQRGMVRIALVDELHHVATSFSSYRAPRGCHQTTRRSIISVDDLENWFGVVRDRLRLRYQRNNNQRFQLVQIGGGSWIGDPESLSNTRHRDHRPYEQTVNDAG